MRRMCMCATAVAAVLAAQPALAQDGGVPAQGAAPVEREDGVLVYPPEFFAAARPNTALDMVQRLPGFSIDQSNQVRGFSGAVGNVLIDGARPASKNEQLSDILGRIPAGQVERIELIRGGAQGVDMQGYALVVNVVRRGGAARQQVLSLSTTVFDDGRQIPALNYALNGRDGDRIYEFALGTSTSINDGVGSGTTTRFDLSGAPISVTDVESEADGRGISTRGRWQQPAFGGTLELTGNIHGYDFKFEQNETSLAGLTAIVESFDVLTGEAGVRYERPLGPRTTLETRAIQRLEHREGAQTVVTPATDILFAYDNLSGETILRGSLRFAQNPRLTWESGLEAAYNFLDASQALTVDGAPVALPSDSVLVEELRAEAFGQATWRPRENLTLEAGLRLESSTISQSNGGETERSFFYPKPRLTLAWSIDPHTQLRLRAEREVSQLNFGDFAASAELANDLVTAGNVDLEPEKRWVFEAALERRFLADGVVTATLRHARITDAIDVVPVAIGSEVFPAPGNIGDGTATEFLLDVTVPTDAVGVSGGRLSVETFWRVSEVTDPTTGEERRISGERPFQTFVTFTQDIGSWNLTWGAEWQPIGEDTVWRIDEISRFHIENYGSAWIEYKPRPDLTLRAQAWRIDGYERTVTVYDGPRDTGAPLHVEERAMEPESRFQLRLRKTF